MLSIVLIIFVAGTLLGIACFAGKRSIRFIAVAVLLAILLQYGSYPFLDEKGKAELLMWQVVSLPVLLVTSLALCGAIWGIGWIVKRAMMNYRKSKQNRG